MDGHWSDDYFGELYLATAPGLLSPRLSALEAGVIARLLRLGPGDRLLDLACGQGRHAFPLAARAGLVVGLERSAEALRGAAAAPSGPPSGGAADGGAAAGGGAPGPVFVRADLRRLPLRPGRFDAVLSWYASLFMYDDPTNEALLAQVAGLLRPGGRLLIQHANPLALAASPVDQARATLPGGGVVEEASSFDTATGVDRCARRLTLPAGRVLQGVAELRYYRPEEWAPLASRAGLRLSELTSTAPPSGGPLGPDAPDLIALLEKP